MNKTHEVQSSLLNNDLFIMRDAPSLRRRALVHIHTRAGAAAAAAAMAAAAAAAAVSS
jgi:hypothetical protein